MKNEVPKYLFSRRYLWSSIVFVTIFSMLFMVIYAPFTGTAWFGFETPKVALNTIVFYAGAIVLLAISKSLLAAVQKRREVILMTEYVIWLAVEMVVIALFYLLYTSLIILPEMPVEVKIGPLLLRTTLCVALILAIPYTFITMYAALQTKKEELAAALTRRHARHEAADHLVNLYDYNGNLKLSVGIDALYYMESQDNYVKVYYESDGKLNNYMLRARTKAVEEMCAQTPMHRCHRSYLVNINKIKLLRNERGNTFIVLDHNSIRPIPISKSYSEQFMEIIEKNKQKNSEEN
ncbi:MAG: LytTR family transcriptional regulator [Tidjanibacter sp.]|nr:LytTR family transcriptional regulator [Tidjanibacter sp.]